MKETSFTAERTAHVFEVLGDPTFIDENFAHQFFSVEQAQTTQVAAAMKTLEANPKFYAGMMLLLLLAGEKPMVAFKVMFLAGLFTGVRVADVLELKRMAAQ